MAKVIGLTGGFGTGKTYAASILRSLGAKVIDADEIARRAVAKGKPAYRKIAAVFGPEVLAKGRQIDRRRLASIVFSDKKALARLNRIVHPEVIRVIKKSIKSCGVHDVVVLDAPLLVEAGLVGLVDLLIVVTAPRKEQVRRCIKKFRIGKEEVMRRIGNQVPIKKKIDMADYVVDNGGERSKTKDRIIRIWKETVWR